jgi:hypothetical protein
VLEPSRERCIPEKKPASMFLETNGFDHIYVAAVKLQYCRMAAASGQVLPVIATRVMPPGSWVSRGNPGAGRGRVNVHKPETDPRMAPEVLLSMLMRPGAQASDCCLVNNLSNDI